MFLVLQSVMTGESVSPPLAAGGGGGGLSPDVMGASGCGTCCTAAAGDRTATGTESSVAVCSCQLAAAASLPPHYASRSTPATTTVYTPYPSTDQNPYPSIDTSSFYPHLVSTTTVVAVNVGTRCPYINGLPLLVGNYARQVLLPIAWNYIWPIEEEKEIIELTSSLKIFYTISEISVLKFW